MKRNDVKVYFYCGSYPLKAINKLFVTDYSEQIRLIRYSPLGDDKIFKEIEEIIYEDKLEDNKCHILFYFGETALLDFAINSDYYQVDPKIQIPYLFSIGSCLIFRITHEGGVLVVSPTENVYLE